MFDKKFYLNEEPFAEHVSAKALLDSSLIPQTNRIKYNTKIVNCNGCIQIYKYAEEKYKNNPNIENNNIKKKRNKEKRKLTEYKPIRLDNAQRSKISLQRLIKANAREFKSFLTLTFEENIGDVYDANKKFNIWRTYISRFKKNFKYVCVPEFQKRGAVHYHLLTNIDYTDFTLLSDTERRIYNPRSGWQIGRDIKGWSYGNNMAKCMDSVNIVGYMSKYMTKDIDNRLYSQKRYFYSKNLIIPKQEFVDINDEKVCKYIENLLDNKTLNYSNIYMDKISKKIIQFNEYA